jgi:hypothetical protein
MRRGGRRWHCWPGAIGGNHGGRAIDRGGPFVLIAHLRRGSLQVRVGEHVAAGRHIGGCGNSGNSTQPHIHLQVTDSTDWASARGLPLAFRTPTGIEVPAESQIIHR